jgi:hypothetical protein
MEVLPIAVIVIFILVKYYSSHIWVNLVDSLKFEKNLTELEERINSDERASGIRAAYYVFRIVFRDIRVSDFNAKHRLSLYKIRLIFLLEIALIVALFYI